MGVFPADSCQIGTWVNRELSRLSSTHYSCSPRYSFSRTGHTYSTVSLLFLVWGINLLVRSQTFSLSLQLNFDSILQRLLLSLCVFCIGAGLNGPKTLLGMCVRDEVSRDAQGLAGGILGIVGQMGGASSGVVIGSLVQANGWSIFIPILFVVSILCSFCLLMSINAKGVAGVSHQSRDKNHVD